MNSNQRLRTRLIFILIVCAGILLASSLYYTQVVKGASYIAKADKQYVRPSTAVFDRGTIFFRAKDETDVSAASMSRGYLLYMNPSLLGDPSNAYEVLSHYLTLDKAEFMRKAAKKDDTYEEVQHKVPENTAGSVTSLSLKGIGLAKESWRSYPGDGLAAHILGLVGENKDGATGGQYGLERTYETTLERAAVGSSASIFAQLFSGIHDTVFGGAQGSGPGGSSGKPGDIVTTIEPTVQRYLETTLAGTSAEWRPDEIGGIIMDPSTGDIVAMSSLPTFNGNDLSNVRDASVFSDPLVEHVYELGSIMKPLTMATALDSGAVKPASTYNDTGCMTLDTKKICNFDGVARNVIPMQEILSQSLNVGAATIALKTDTSEGKGTFAKYFSSYGFGDKTGIDQPNEATGILGNLNKGQDIAVATAAYGQGIAISPIEMVRALSILANGGYLVTPHIVSEIGYADGTVKEIAPQKSEPVLKKQTTDDVTAMLVKVVDVSLKKGAIKMDHYSIAAKTGTAQVPDHVHGGYYSDRYLHSFFGYFPAYNPKYIVFLYQIYPKGAEYASATLTDPFSQIAKFLINYYNVPPDR